jgi:hypothetical protein
MGTSRQICEQMEKEFEDQLHMFVEFDNLTKID